MLKKLFHTIHPVQVAVAFFAGVILALIVKDDLTPLLTGGISFDVRSLPGKLALMAFFTFMSGFCLFVLIRIYCITSEDCLIKPSTFLAGIGGLTGMLIFYLVYGTGTLDPGRVDWLFNLGDNAQHYLGWVFYRNDPWTWPAGFSCSLGYPTGTCMCFTDSIPLLAIPFKVIRSLLPNTFQYFGIWTLLCFFLQGMFAALILYEVTGRKVPALIAPLFFCTADVLLFRVFRYTPLTGQWIIFFALYLYFLNKRTTRWNALWPLVHGMAVLIQGYFFVMTFVVHIGALLERFLIDRKWVNALRDGLIGLGSTVLVMWVVGFFTASVEMSNTGLGYFKANLNAFINPLPGWSRFFPPLPLAEGTYAMNVNYLGVGIILLVTIGLVVMGLKDRKDLKRIWHGNSGLLVIIPVLVVFALSNVVTFNEHVLFSYSLPEPLLRLWGVFRGTERMLWPVYYLIFVFAINHSSRVSPRQWIVAFVLLAAFGLQLAEVYPQLDRFHREYDEPQGRKTPLRSDFWIDAANEYESVVVLPLSLDNWARLTEFAAENRMRINYSYYARYSPEIEPAAEKKMQDLFDGTLLPDEMYILKSPDLFQKVCGQYQNSDDFLGYIDGEWVLAPDFMKTVSQKDYVTITGAKANCEGLSLEEFLQKYSNKLVILSAMDDVSGLGFTPEGMSYLGIRVNSKMIYENQAEEKIELVVKQDNPIQGTPLPVTLTIISAGRLSGEEDALIEIDGRDFSYHRPGLNIVVLDPENGDVIDTALFTTTP